MTNFLFVRATANKKTGPIPVTINDSKTCPDACSLKKNGCYADHGPLQMAWKRVDKGEGNATDFDGICEKISALPKRSLWRYAVAGDLPGENNVVSHEDLAKLVKANKGRRGFSFTHKPVGMSSDQNIVKDAYVRCRKAGSTQSLQEFANQALINSRAIYAANKSGFTINLSADSIEQADELKSLGIGPVAVVIPEDSPHKATKTPAGNTLVVCPAVTNEEITCQSCGLCAISTRKCIVGFPAHGCKKKHVSQLVQLRKKSA